MKTKTLDSQIREYVKKISEEDLRYLSVRLSQRLGGDLGDALCLIYDGYPELNKILTGAGSCDETYNVIDLIDKYVQESLTKKVPVGAR